MTHPGLHAMHEQLAKPNSCRIRATASFCVSSRSRRTSTNCVMHASMGEKAIPDPASPAGSPDSKFIQNLNQQSVPPAGRLQSKNLKFFEQGAFAPLLSSHSEEIQKHYI